VHETTQCPPLRVRLHLNTGGVVVDLAGELDVATSPQVLALEQLIRDHGGQAVINLRHLIFIDAAGVSAFLHLANALPSFSLTNPTGIVARVLAITSTDYLVDSQPSPSSPDGPSRPLHADVLPTRRRRRSRQG
jgi:anti-anti-sigma factor